MKCFYRVVMCLLVAWVASLVAAGDLKAQCGDLEVAPALLLAENTCYLNEYDIALNFPEGGYEYVLVAVNAAGNSPDFDPLGTGVTELTTVDLSAVPDPNDQYINFLINDDSELANGRGYWFKWYALDAAGDCAGQSAANYIFLHPPYEDFEVSSDVTCTGDGTGDATITITITGGSGEGFFIPGLESDDPDDTVFTIPATVGDTYAASISDKSNCLGTFYLNIPPIVCPTCPTSVDSPIADVIEACGNADVSLPATVALDNDEIATFSWTQDGQSIDAGDFNVAHSGDPCNGPETTVFALTIGCTEDSAVALDGGSITVTVYPDDYSSALTIPAEVGCSAAILNTCPEAITVLYSDGAGGFTADEPAALSSGDSVAFDYIATAEGAPEGCSTEGNYTVTCPDCEVATLVTGIDGDRCEDDLEISAEVSLEGGNNSESTISWLLNGEDTGVTGPSFSATVDAPPACGSASYQLVATVSCSLEGIDATLVQAGSITVYDSPEQGVDFNLPDGGCDWAIQPNCDGLNIAYTVNDEPFSGIPSPLAAGESAFVGYEVSVPGAPAGCSSEGNYAAACACAVPQASFEASCDGSDFFATVTISDFGSASAYSLTDNQGTPALEVTESGTYTFGSYDGGSTAFITLVSADDSDCNISSEALSLVCCTADAGTMPSETSILCAGVDLSIATDSPVTGAEESLVYYVHTSETLSLDEVLASGATGDFSLADVGGSTNTLYYVSAVAFSDDGSGMPDLSGDCLDISTSSFVFLDPIQIMTSETVCDNTDTYSVEVTMSGGLPAYDGSSYIVSGTESGERPAIYVLSGVPSNTEFVVEATDGNGCTSNSVSGNQNCECQSEITITELEHICYYQDGYYEVILEITGGNPQNNDGNYTLSGTVSQDVAAGSTVTIQQGLGTPVTIVASDGIGPGSCSESYASEAFTCKEECDNPIEITVVNSECFYDGNFYEQTFVITGGNPDFTNGGNYAVSGTFEGSIAEGVEFTVSQTIGENISLEASDLGLGITECIGIYLGGDDINCVPPECQVPISITGSVSCDTATGGYLATVFISGGDPGGNGGVYNVSGTNGGQTTVAAGSSLVVAMAQGAPFAIMVNDGTDVGSCSADFSLAAPTPIVISATAGVCDLANSQYSVSVTISGGNPSANGNAYNVSGSYVGQAVAGTPFTVLVPIGEELNLQANDGAGAGCPATYSQPAPNCACDNPISITATPGVCNLSAGNYTVTVTISGGYPQANSDTYNVSGSFEGQNAAGTSFELTLPFGEPLTINANDGTSETSCSASYSQPAPECVCDSPIVITADEGVCDFTSGTYTVTATINGGYPASNGGFYNVSGSFGGQIAAGQPLVVTLNYGEALNLIANDGTGAASCSGTLVQDAPICECEIPITFDVGPATCNYSAGTYTVNILLSGGSPQANGGFYYVNGSGLQNQAITPGSAFPVTVSNGVAIDIVADDNGLCAAGYIGPIPDCSCQSDIIAVAVGSDCFYDQGFYTIDFAISGGNPAGNQGFYFIEQNGISYTHSASGNSVFVAQAELGQPITLSLTDGGICFGAVTENPPDCQPPTCQNPIIIEPQVICDTEFPFATYIVLAEISGGNPVNGQYQVTGTVNINLPVNPGGGASVLQLDMIAGEAYNIAVSDGGVCQASFISEPITCKPETAIDLIGFNGRSLDIGNLLYWSTAQEIDNDHFLLQRSLDGLNFELVGRIDAVGNSDYLVNYDFVDYNAPLGTAYYRLDAVGASGELSSSGILTLKQGQEGFELTSVAPVPVSDLLQVGFSLDRNANMQIEVFDLTGRRLIEQTRQVSAGLGLVQLDVANLVTGAYLIKLSTEGQVQTRKFIKQ